MFKWVREPVSKGARPLAHPTFQTQRERGTARGPRLLGLLLLAWMPFAAAYEGVGRPATADEVRAWDIDVRPDFTGLPRGSGSVRKGEEVWEAKCASCHGTFGESNQVFPPIAGGVTAQDIDKGRVAALARGGEQRTTLMKLSQISTLWDYINRAMPWNAPKTLSVEEVYAVTAYILSLDKIVPDDFVLSDANIGAVQQRLPNRNGMSRAHGLWEVKGKPDVSATVCMRDCPVAGKVLSRLPDSARANHGNLAEQNRTIGPVRGIATPAGAAPATVAPAAAAPAAAQQDATKALAERSGCLACHGATARLVGPSLDEIAKKYAGDGTAPGRLVAKVRDGGQGVWGAVPMPPHPQLKENELQALVRWVLTDR